MRVNNSVIHPTSRRLPAQLFKGGVSIPPPVTSMLIGSLVGIVLMDYLMKMSLYNQYYHGQIGVYKR